jgi:formylglycine-generating enzyme required for sulfatase activity
MSNIHKPTPAHNAPALNTAIAAHLAQQAPTRSPQSALEATLRPLQPSRPQWGRLLTVATAALLSLSALTGCGKKMTPQEREDAFTLAQKIASEGRRSEAVQLYRDLADDNHASSQFALGAALLIGQGVEKNEKQAAKWFRKAAEQGHAGAQHILGLALSTGNGVAKDEAEAAQWFRKAAEQNWPDAQYNLGNALLFGKGIPSNREEAIVWLRKAREEGNSEARKLLLQIERVDTLAEEMDKTDDVARFVWRLTELNTIDFPEPARIAGRENKKFAEYIQNATKNLLEKSELDAAETHLAAWEKASKGLLRKNASPEEVRLWAETDAKMKKFAAEFDRLAVSKARTDATRRAIASAANESSVAKLVAELPSAERPVVEEARLARLDKLKNIRIAKSRERLRNAATEQEIAAIITDLPGAERSIVEKERIARTIEVRAEHESRLAELKDARIAKATEALEKASTEQEVSAIVSDLPADEQALVSRVGNARLAELKNARITKARRALKTATDDQTIADIVTDLPEAERPLVEKERVARIAQLIELKNARITKVRRDLEKAATTQEIAVIVATLPKSERGEIEKEQIAHTYRVIELKNARIAKANAALKIAPDDQVISNIITDLPEDERTLVAQARTVRLRELKNARIAKASAALKIAPDDQAVASIIANLPTDEHALVGQIRSKRISELKNARITKAREGLKKAVTEQEISNIIAHLPADEHEFVEDEKVSRQAALLRASTERNARLAKVRTELKNATTPQAVAAVVATLPEIERPLVEKERVGQLAQLVFLQSLKYPRRVLLPGNVPLDFMPAPAGTFMMGKPNSKDSSNWSHKVTLTKPFLIGRYEVTQEQWQAVMEGYPKEFLDKEGHHNEDLKARLKKNLKHPMIYVSWEDAIAFSKKLTEQERKAGRLPIGWKYTLPTEAQWEYACRAGTTGDYSGTGKALEMGWDMWGRDEPHDVGLKRANAWGRECPFFSVKSLAGIST